MEHKKNRWVIGICGTAVLLAAIICVFVIGFALGGQRGEPSPQETLMEEFSTYYQVTADTMLYEQTSDTSNVLKSVKEGAVVVFLGVGENDFYMVQEEESYGYIKKQFLRPVSVENQEEEPPVMMEENTAVTALYEMYVVNCKQSVSLRSRPSMQAEALMQIAKGERVGYVESAQNGFVKVLYDGRTGYILGSYLSYENQSSDITIKKTMYVVKCNTDISLRSAPSVSAGVMLTIPLHDPVGYISDAGNEFHKISYRGIIGYALAEYLANTIENTVETPVKTLYVVNCDAYITLRNAPSTSAGEISKIPLGQSVGYIGNASSGFYKVQYNGQTGYALASYLSETLPSSSQENQTSVSVQTGAPPATVTQETGLLQEEAPAEKESDVAAGEKMYVINCKENITLRLSPDVQAEGLMMIPLGAEVEYIADAANGFYQIRYQGTEGYAKAEYLSIDPAA